ncbi:hypothetical protein ACV3RC_04360 [Clostridium perfringens]|uniref:hypothetical protein n=1 Tax=Clostridium perfringens TaxID=1502 RepID=UPI001C846588|nr:hypothetical protein [Clostridium perfringens]EHK2305040.1 hypothetical protein [Clostridium perfringens]MDK0605654.1 hypothetical protein [Clostridium perfringens]MDK0764946.1 hypothetical protein [Clostridium perfringens]MDK0923873.1 hypothetical protein [Clostridium perfringens]MDM0896321.1 hypothetical protein [Clostridium perfringens]
MKKYIKTTISRNKLYEKNYTRDSIEKIELTTIDKINSKMDKALIDILTKMYSEKFNIEGVV